LEKVTKPILLLFEYLSDQCWKEARKMETSMEQSITHSPGDWVVHSYYGVGQIIKIEVKPIHDVDMPCYRVKTRDGTYWFPTTGTANPRIRPVASQEIVKNMISTLRSEASTLDTDRTIWKQKIEESQVDNDLLSISALIRDLSAQQVIRNLNQIERDALNLYKERLLREWDSIVPVEIEELRSKLNSYIQESQSKIKLPEGRKK
jgi:RNA polymerase-interacting CarD/CdnL/TRCF family regulator